MRINQPIVGFIFGVLSPVVGLLVVYFIFNRELSVGQFISQLSHNHKLLSKMMSLSLLANAVPFVLLTNRRLDYAARGVFIATMLYALAIVLLKIM